MDDGLILNLVNDEPARPGPTPQAQNAKRWEIVSWYTIRAS